MADQPLPAPETPEENRRRVERERAGTPVTPKGTNRRAKHTQAKPTKKAKRIAWAGAAKENRHG